MSLWEYTAGLGWFGVTVGAVGAAAALLLRHRLDHLRGADRALALALLVSGGLVAAHLVPGLLGVLFPPTVALAALALLGVAVFDARSARAAGAAVPPGRAALPVADGPPSAAAAERVSWALALLALLGVALFVGPAISTAATTPVTAYDMLGFKLPNVARWVESASAWGFHLFLPMKNTGSYPQNGDLLILGAALPWDNDAFVRLVQAPFWAVAGLAVYALGRQLGAPAPTALLFGALFAAMPVVAATAFDNALPDTFMLATFGAGTVFLVRHAGSGGTSDLVLAGIGLGLAAGTKWYGVSAVPVLLACWAAWRLAAGQSLRRVVSGGGLVAGVAAVVAGFWFVRNLIEVGNPFYPVRLSVLGVSVLDAPVDLERPVYGLAISDYLDDGGAWSDHLLPAFERMFSPAGLLMLATALALVGWALVARTRRGMRPPAGAAVMLSVAALSMAVIYLLTPYSAQGFGGEPEFAFVNTRWVAPAFLLAAGVGAWGTALLGPRSRIAVEALVMAGAIDAARRGLPSPGLESTLGTLALAGGCYAAYRWRRLGRHALRPAALASVSAALVLVLGCAGYLTQRAFNDDRYVGIDPVFDRVLEDSGERRVGLSGNWDDRGPQPTWPLFGRELDNDVEYVGEVVRGRLEPPGSEGEWRRRVARERYDLLMVGTAPHVVGDADEALWARRSGLRRLAASRRFALYEGRKARR